MRRLLINRTFIFVLLFFVVTLYADLGLVIDPYKQSGYKTCWAACCKMILDAYGYPETEATLRCWVIPPPQGESCTATMGNYNDKVNDLYGGSKSVDEVLVNFGTIYGTPVQYDLAREELSYEITDGRPFICGRLNADNSRHMVLVKGYRGNGGENVNIVIFNNPFYYEEQELPYSEFVYSNYFYWLETYLLTTDPRTPIPTPVDPPNWIQITTGTGEITPSTTSLSYSASRNFSSSATWTWKLVFLHEYGYCTARSWTVTGNTSKSMTWNITNFSMPAGYQWKYCFSGKVPGRLELSIGTLKDAINVLYAPANLYPGILIYQNKAISSLQSDIKAHEVILMRDDQFNSGANIDFKSGESITIEDGVTINNGSSVDFIVDGTLR